MKNGRGRIDPSSPRVSTLAFLWREPFANQIPVPCIAPYVGSRVLQWLELESVFRQPHRTSVFDEPFSIRGHEVRHLVPLPHVTMEPQPTIHRVDHPFPTLFELDVINRWWQSVHVRHEAVVTGRPLHRRS